MEIFIILADIVPAALNSPLTLFLLTLSFLFGFKASNHYWQLAISLKFYFNSFPFKSL